MDIDKDNALGVLTSGDLNKIAGLLDKQFDQRLANLATKDELNNAVKRLATKDELNNAVKQLATKDELNEAVKQLVTKNDLTEAVNTLDTKITQGVEAVMGGMDAIDEDMKEIYQRLGITRKSSLSILLGKDSLSVN